MPSITNVGGSLTSAVALTLIAWAVRFVRARNSRKQDEKELQKQLGRYHASISASALQMLVRHCIAFPFITLHCLRFGLILQVETDPIPYVVIDVRDKHQVEQNALPSHLGHVMSIPGMF